MSTSHTELAPVVMLLLHSIKAMYCDMVATLLCNAPFNFRSLGLLTSFLDS